MDVFSLPGSLTVYSSAGRPGLPPPNDCPPQVGPASYGNVASGIRARQDTVAPFDTSAIRDVRKPNGFPSPCEYNPVQRPRHAHGTPSFEVGPRFPEGMYCSDDSPGPIYKPLDAWDKMVQDTEILLTTKRPRVQPERFVSNNVPTVFNPRDMKQFVVGLDGRMYPWWKKYPEFDSPGPKYDTSKSRTSASRRVAEIDFSTSCTRRDVFKPIPGFGAADFNTRQPLNQTGGVFLSKTDDPKSSGPRLFDILQWQAIRNAPVAACARTPTPPSQIDNCFCPKVVTAPFKSTAPRLASDGASVTGPGPATYFQQQKRMQDIDPPLIGYSFSQPPEGAPFNNSAERFPDELCNLPGPGDYFIYGFTDMMQYYLCRHAPAVVNPKLGFLTSAAARSKELFKGFELEFSNRPPTVPGKWRNLRPKRIRTAPFHGPPMDSGTPAPNAYDTRPAVKFLKDKKSGWNPRDYTGSGFGNSGCGRQLKIADIDYDNPGPKYAVPSEFPGPGGFVKRTGARFAHSTTDGPGPRHKPHEKGDSMWRASQLGTTNVFLKGIDRVCPTAGGFHPHGPLDALGDRQRGYCRVDDYADEIIPKTAFDELVKKKHESEKIEVEQEPESVPAVEQEIEEVPGEVEEEELGEQEQIPHEVAEFGGEDGEWQPPSKDAAVVEE